MENIKYWERKMEEEINGFYLDDGTKVDPDLVSKPSLCITCIKDDDPSELILCTLNRIDQRDDPEFKCYAYEPKPDKPEITNNKYQI
ncbi:MAG: hypothetical protein K8R79_10895 [Calditrichales bacterium]|nr:hypothetical protein [Calditrichales bacterium]